MASATTASAQDMEAVIARMAEGQALMSADRPAEAEAVFRQVATEAGVVSGPGSAEAATASVLLGDADASEREALPVLRDAGEASKARARRGGMNGAARTDFRRLRGLFRQTVSAARAEAH